MAFNKKDLEITKEVMNSGLLKAAQSMSFFTKNDVSIKGLEIQIQPISNVINLINKGDQDEITVLTTEIIGDVGGLCYLIFSKNEVGEIIKMSLPESILNDPDKLPIMSDAILLEMDNIIVASVVTELANYLDFKIYGNVPAISKTIPNGFRENFESTNKNANYFLYIKSELRTDGLDINPEFIWLLDEKFEKAIKDIARNESHISN